MMEDVQNFSLADLVLQANLSPSANSGGLQMASTATPTIEEKSHTPICANNCELSHHELVLAMFLDGRCANARIPRSGDLPIVLKQGIESAKLSGWDQNSDIPDPAEELRCPLLFLACTFGKTGIVKALLRNNFDPCVVNQHGETALHYTARYLWSHNVAPYGGAKVRTKKALESFKQIVKVLSDCDPKILAMKDDSGSTALHVLSVNIMRSQNHSSVMHGLSLSGRAAHFFQLCLKSLIRRLLKLLDASIFTRREVVEIIKIAEITYGDSVIHILARDSAYGFEVLQFLQDWLFAGKLPDEKNKENKTALAVACETDPQGAMEMFVLPFLIPSDNHQQPQQNQPAESPTQSTQFEETLLSNDGGVSTNVVDVDIRVPQTSHFSSPEEFPDIDTGNLFPHFTVPVIGNQGDLPYIAEVFSLCSKESLTSGKISDSSSMLEGLIMPSSVEIVESPAEVSSASDNPSWNNISASVETCINVDNSLGLGALGLKSSNVLGMAFTQYSDKLSELVESLPKLDHLIEEAAAVIDKKISRVNLLEKKLDVVKRDALAKMKSIQELRSKKELLCNETRRLKRNLDYCQEKQYQLVNHCKKGRLP